MDGDGRNHKSVQLEAGFLAGAGGRPGSPPVSLAALRAASLFAVCVETGGLRCRVKVQLQVGDALYEGVASGPDSPRQRLRLAAAAAVQAVEELLGGVVPLAVEDLREVALGPRTAVVLSLALPGDEGEDCLIGSALLRHDPAEAGARAVLDAVQHLRRRWEDDPVFRRAALGPAAGKSPPTPG
ncbi:MAG TPA: hypothetical protein VIK93_04150 [Limnochordales bacterium]